MNDIRLIELYDFDALGSQAIYHALAEKFDSQSPDTVILVSPDQAYVCAGYHQDVEREIDMQACKALGLPITRRQVGGGAVLLDNGQVFIQWVFKPASLPYSIEERYVLFIAPLLATYRQIGINATYRPINDIHVGGRKIGGTGAARIGEAEVLVGSIMFNFDGDTMAKSLRVASEKMRDKLIDTLSEYVTSIQRELAEPPERDQVTREYISQLELTLGRRVVPGTLTPDEEASLAEVRQMLGNDDWVLGGRGRKILGTKIHEDVTVFEGVHKAPGGLVRWIFIGDKGKVADATIEGDFTIEPSDIPLNLAQKMLGLQLSAGAIGQGIRSFFDSSEVTMPGLTCEDFISAAANALKGAPTNINAGANGQICN